MGFHYEHAPITEALIDIRVEALPTAQLDVIEAIYDAVKDEYPDKQPMFRRIAFLHPNQTVPAKDQQIGFSFKSRDAKQIFQAQLDGFTVSRLRPYGTWGDLKTRARLLWEHYRAAIGPQRIVRVAVRYINQVDMPLETDLELKDYFRTSPEISPVLNQNLGGFFMQLRLPQADFGGTLLLTQASTASPRPDIVSVILDLDVIKEQPQFSSDEEVWDLLQVLRNRKNEYFEGCLTDKACALFGERTTSDGDN